MGARKGGKSRYEKMKRLKIWRRDRQHGRPESVSQSEHCTVSISLNRNTHQPIMESCLRINHLTGPFSKHYPVKPNVTYLCLLSPPIPQSNPLPCSLSEQSRLLPQARAGNIRAKSQQSRRLESPPQCLLTDKPALWTENLTPSMCVWSPAATFRPQEWDYFAPLRGKNRKLICLLICWDL